MALDYRTKTELDIAARRVFHYMTADCCVGDMPFCLLSAKDALGRRPTINDIGSANPQSYTTARRGEKSLPGGCV